MKVKKFLILFLITILCAPAFAAKKINVVSSVFPIHQMTRNVANGSQNLNIEILLPATMGCPHDYSLTPQDIRKISQADVLIINGLGLEEFIGQPTKRANPNVKIIDASKGIKALPAAKEEDDDKHHQHESFNPHLFSSPRMAAKQVIVIGNALAQIDPANAKLYQKNAKDYAEKLNKLADDFKNAVKTFTSKKIVTMHEVFDYLAVDTGLEIAAVIEEHAGIEPSAAKMMKLIKQIKSSGAAAIFTEPQYPQRQGKTLAREANVKIDSLDPAASGPKNAPLDYYEKVMKKNLDTLKKVMNANTK